MGRTPSRPLRRRKPTTTTEPVYIDPRTASTYPLHEAHWRGDSGGPLMISLLPGIQRSQIRSKVRSLWRYAAALPVAVAEPVSLGEGWTPMIQREWHGAVAHLKLEWFAPTGSFKDRGASVMISILRQIGVREVLEDSSGNGGAAIAAYAAAAGMKAKILAPTSTPPAKLVQMRAYGAVVEQVPGSRQATADAAVREADRIFYASHNWQPLFLQGTKTLAYEIWENLGFRAPDNVLIPLGAGSNVLGCDIGFDELLRRRLIRRRPRLFGVQPANCAPIHASFSRGTEDPVETTVLPTVAEGTAIAKPLRLREVLHAIRRSAGSTVAITESAILSAAISLARQGLYVEPTSAQAAAALTQLLDEGTIGREETSVLILTGSGLKATQRYQELLES
jgi:threonine synthase